MTVGDTGSGTKVGTTDSATIAPPQRLRTRCQYGKLRILRNAVFTMAPGQIKFSTLGCRASLAILLAIVSSACNAATDKLEPENDVVVISVLGTNDAHGELLPQPGRGGLTTLSGYIAALRAVRAADNGGVLLIDGGDMWQGTLESNIEWLAIRYGPLPLFWRRLLYASITAAEAARSDWLDGGGIHYMPGRGWIYNLWGRDCVKLHLVDKKVRIGTNDVEGLLRFVKTKVG